MTKEEIIQQILDGIAKADRAERSLEKMFILSYEVDHLYTVLGRLVVQEHLDTQSTKPV